MKKIGFLFIFSLLITSCAKVEIYQDIDKNGVSKIQMNYDLSKMKDIQSSVKTMSGTISNSSSGTTKNPCDEFKNSDNSKIKNFSCIATDDSHMSISGSIDISKSGFFYSSGGIYIINITKNTDGLNQDNSNSGSESTPEEKEQTQKMLAAMGFEMNQNINMPGKIVKTEIGKIENNTIKIGITDMTGSLDYYAISTDENVNLGVDELNKILVNFKNSTINLVDEKDSIKFKKQIINSKSKLKKSNKSKYINQIDQIVAKAEKVKLKKVFDKIQKLSKKSSTIEYLESKIYFELLGTK